MQNTRPLSYGLSPATTHFIDVVKAHATVANFSQGALSASCSKEVNSITFQADEDLRGRNILPLTSLLQEVLKVPREKPISFLLYVACTTHNPPSRLRLMPSSNSVDASAYHTASWNVSLIECNHSCVPGSGSINLLRKSEIRNKKALPSSAANDRNRLPNMLAEQESTKGRPA